MALTTIQRNAVRDMVLFSEGYRRATRFLIDGGHAATNSQARAILSRIVMEDLGVEIFDTIHAIRDLECSHGTTVTGNHSKITTALADKAQATDFYLPSGILRIDDSITFPDRGGTVFRGAGGAGKEGNENYFYSPSARLSRIGWWGNSVNPMIDLRGQGAVLEKLLLQGAVEFQIAAATNAIPVVITAFYHGYSTGDVVDVYGVDGNTSANGRWTITVIDAHRFSIPIAGNGTYNTSTASGRCKRSKALVGVRVNTYSGGTNTGKAVIRDCSFWDTQTAILFGADMDNLDADSYASENYNNADCSRLHNLAFHYQYDDNPNSEPRTCMRVRTGQGIDYVVSGWLVHGNPSEVFYFERGGAFTCEGVSLSGATSLTNPVVLVRLGKVWPDTSGRRLSFHIDGSTGGLGQPGGNFRLLQMDKFRRYGSVYMELFGSIGPRSYATPIVVARGACMIVLRGVNNLIPGVIQMLGTSFSGSKVVANVHLEGCSLRGAYPADLVHASSAGPWRLSWSNCCYAPEANGDTSDYGRPLANGAIESADVSPGLISV